MYLKLFIVYYIILYYCYILWKYVGYITSATSVERLFHFSIVAVAEVILYKNVISITSATSVGALRGRLYFRSVSTVDEMPNINNYNNNNSGRCRFVVEILRFTPTTDPSQFFVLRTYDNLAHQKRWPLALKKINWSHSKIRTQLDVKNFNSNNGRAC